MVSSATKSMDYFDWAKDLDVIANDHYLVAADPERQIELAFSADLTRGVAGGAPWILMEHSTSAVNWQPRNQPKMPGEMLRNSLAHVARGADAVMFFQWRQSFAGSEKFHSAMVPHGGRDTRVWREVVELGASLQKLGQVAGPGLNPGRPSCSTTKPGGPAKSIPTRARTSKYLDLIRAFHRSLFLRGISVDFVHPAAIARRLRPSAGVHALQRHRRCRSQYRCRCPGRRDGPGQLLQRDSRRTGPHPARRLSGRVP